ncbi:MAG: hypothetical protein CSA20_07030 [Deltaproteobacteria bacterium]|nr:MAG: hypothetical protein CSA20_07030 [Deltaproteobacteria bacterium]
MITVGLENICKTPLPELKGKRLGLLSNQASTDCHYVHARDRILQAYPGQLRVMFSPQHGFFSEKQDNMIESDHVEDAVTGLTVYSLYGETRRPYPEMFADIDVLLVDLVDVGTRVYTFIWTIVSCLEVAAETGVQVMILDRPNPIGGHLTEGNILTPDCFSFVGMCPIPMRHGLTMAELAMLCNSELSLGAHLSVVPLKGWKRNMFFPQTDFPWVSPSPNMPSLLTALVYPGQVIWEGTTVSEGRGTTMPFELVGAPYLDHYEVLDTLRAYDLPGCIFRPVAFEPVSGKYAGNVCRGFQLHVTDPGHFRPYRTSLALLQVLLRLYPETCAYRKPPYEYEYERLPIDLIIGDRNIRQQVEQGASVAELEAKWQPELLEFEQKRRAVFLYE